MAIFDPPGSLHCVISHSEKGTLDDKVYHPTFLTKPIYAGLGFKTEEEIRATVRLTGMIPDYYKDLGFEFVYSNAPR